MSTHRIEQLESEIADLKARWPKHSAKPWMWQKLEELEETLQQAHAEASSEEQAEDAKEAGPG